MQLFIYERSATNICDWSLAYSFICQKIPQLTDNPHSLRDNGVFKSFPIKFGRSVRQDSSGGSLFSKFLTNLAHTLTKIIYF